MAETTEKTGEKKLSVAPTKTLTLKGRGVEQGVVRQSFSHGRTKAVVVEKVKSRGPARRRPSRPPRPRPPSALPPGSGCQRGAAAAPAPSRSPARRETFRRGAANPDRGRAYRPCARAGRRPAARGRRAQDRRGRGAAPQVSAKAWSRPSATPPKPARPTRRSVASTRPKPSSRPSRRQEALRRGRGHDRRRGTTPPRRRRAARPVSLRARRGRRLRARFAAVRAAPRARRPRRRPTAKPARRNSRGRLTLVTALTADEERERSVASFRRRTQRLKGHAAERAEGKARARSYHPGNHHHPGTRQPHGRARRWT